MIVALSMWFFLIILELGSSINIINPTISNSSGDYYITSISLQKNFSNSSIICRYVVKNCYIFCDTACGCTKTPINGTNANYLKYDSNQNYASVSLVLYSSSNMTIINCISV